MSQGWSKLFSRINWFNRPIKTTSLGATNLNKNDYALDKIDDRVITLDAIKADKIEINGMVSDVSLDNTTGILTITYKDGSEKTYNTNLQKIAVNFGYDSETERLILTMPDGTTQYVDLSALITQFEFVNSSTIAFSVDSSGKVSASIKNGSITESMLETGYLANIKVEVAKAEAAATQAQSSEASSDYNAKLSRSYAIGGSGIRDGEDTDNAMYYNEQAKEALSKMQDAQVTGVKGAKETTYRKGEVNLTAENIGAVAVGGDTADNIVSFTSADSKDVTAYTDVDVLTTGETHKSIFAKISTMFKNIRYLYKMLGSTDISSIGDGTATGAISTLNSNNQIVKINTYSGYTILSDNSFKLNNIAYINAQVSCTLGDISSYHTFVLTPEIPETLKYFQVSCHYGSSMFTTIARVKTNKEIDVFVTNEMKSAIGVNEIVVTIDTFYKIK